MVEPMFPHYLWRIDPRHVEQEISALRGKIKPHRFARTQRRRARSSARFAAFHAADLRSRPTISILNWSSSAVSPGRQSVRLRLGTVGNPQADLGGAMEFTISHFSARPAHGAGFSRFHRRPAHGRPLPPAQRQPHRPPPPHPHRSPASIRKPKPAANSNMPAFIGSDRRVPRFPRTLVPVPRSSRRSRSLDTPGKVQRCGTLGKAQTQCRGIPGKSCAGAFCVD